LEPEFTIRCPCMFKKHINRSDIRKEIFR